MLHLQTDVLGVLPFVAQQISGTMDMCTCLQVCKPWNKCLSGCPPSVSVCVLVGTSTHTLREAAAVALWLQQYGNLVQYLEVRNNDEEEGDLSDTAAVAESLVAQGLQLAAAKLRPLQLMRVYKEGLYTSAFLSGLAAANVTDLQLINLSPDADCKQALACGLGRLLSVRELSLRGAWQGMENSGVFPAACLSELKQLGNLTRLTLTGSFHRWESGVEELLPVQLKSFSIGSVEAVTGDYQHLSSLSALTLSGDEVSLSQLPAQLQQLSVRTSGSCLLSLSSVTGLSSLSASASNGLASGCSFPPSLTRLTFRSTPLPADLSVLGRVVSLTMECIPAQSAALWQQLGRLSSLQKLSLLYRSLDSAAATAAAWGNLPCLQSLSVGNGYGRGSEAQLGEEDREFLTTIVSSIGSARSVQALYVNLCDSDVPCGLHISKLSRLQSLNLSCSATEKGDLLQLTKLSQLTELEQVGVTHADDAVCASLACALTRLVKLEFWDSSLGDVCLVIIAHQLKQLQSLKLGLGKAVTDTSLPCLLQMTQLSSLRLSPTAFSEAGRSQLRGALPSCCLFLR